MKLVWHQGTSLWERKWLTTLLADVVDDEIDVGEGDLSIAGGEIHAICVGNRSLDQVLPARGSVRADDPVGLIHLGDEYYTGGYDRYDEFDFVIRNCHTNLCRTGNVLTIPLGYAAHTPLASALRPATTRNYVWSFIGEMKSSRYAMYRALRGVEPHFFRSERSVGRLLSRDPKQYWDVMADSVFAPSPMGNVMLESFRFYEALEFGCIPIIERRPLIDYYAALLGPHPIPCFTRWKKAAWFCTELSSVPAELDLLQSRIQTWWTAYKQDLAKRIRSFISDALTRRGSSRATCYADGFGFQALRMIELCRHHSTEALVRRACRTLRRVV